VQKKLELLFINGNVGTGLLFGHVIIFMSSYCLLFNVLSDGFYTLFPLVFCGMYSVIAVCSYRWIYRFQRVLAAMPGMPFTSTRRGVLWLTGWLTLHKQP